MRPTDENQSTSMRPNLMSPRRFSSSGEDSILAMLEREPARKRGKGTSRLRLVWYGASATLALTLTGALVWMAANNDGLRPEVQETVLAEARHAPRRSTSAASDSPTAAATIVQVAMAPATSAPGAQAAGAAVVLDQAPPAEPAPPLRLLKPAAQQPAAAPPARAVAKPGSLARPALTPAKSRPAKHTVKAVQPRAQRGPHPARTAEAPVDADVALISAVIVHANGHAPENSQMTELLCPKGSCQARPARE